MDTNQNGHRSFERRRTICTAARAATFVTIHARRVQPHGVFPFIYSWRGSEYGRHADRGRID
ncbi:MAG: hypothetical protein ACJ8J7_05170 [Sulfurifustaceae bacterium]